MEDEIYQGPRRYAPIQVEACSCEIGSRADEYFAKGRRLYNEGYSPSSLGSGMASKNSTLMASLRDGYNWQKKRNIRTQQRQAL
tara:strand:- start:1913 stop:2164 length:252 start_codon:yes stop_codon:yes gene_type:complete